MEEQLQDINPYPPQTPENPFPGDPAPINCDIPEEPAQEDNKEEEETT